jgi:hypothetical protein
MSDGGKTLVIYAAFCVGALSLLAWMVLRADKRLKQMHEDFAPSGPPDE